LKKNLKNQISDDLEQQLFGMGFGGAGLPVVPGVVVPRRLPDSPPVQLQPQAGRNLPGYAAWREWENGQARAEELQQPNPPPLLENHVRTSRSDSQDVADNAAVAWQRNVVRIFTLDTLV
jgi:hypothetical protein